MLDRFGDDARAVLQQAAAHARRQGRRVIGTGCVLVALLRCEDKRLARILRDLGLRRGTLLQQAASARGAEDDPSPATRLFDPPPSSCVRVVLGVAQREAAARIDDTVRPEHLFVGLLAARTGTAALVLRRAGITLESVRRAAAPR